MLMGSRQAHHYYFSQIMHYRRVYIEGGCYFLTVVTEKPRKIFSDRDNVKHLRRI